MRIRRKIAAFVGGLAIVASGLIVAPAAQATTTATARNGVCESGEFCLYYNSNQGGSVSDFRGSVTEYGPSQPSCYEFRGRGAGKGKCVINDTASVWNRTGKNVAVFSYDGFYQNVASGKKANLKATVKNKNDWHFVGKVPAYGTPAVNTKPSRSNPNASPTPRALFVKRQVAVKTGETQCSISGTRGYASDHSTGNALDCTISNAIGSLPSAKQKAQGWALAKWARQHASRLKVSYVIWDGRIWSAARNSEGWRKYTFLQGVVGQHLDHVHISVLNPNS